MEDLFGKNETRNIKGHCSASMLLQVVITGHQGPAVKVLVLLQNVGVIVPPSQLNTPPLNNPSSQHALQTPANTATSYHQSFRNTPAQWDSVRYSEGDPPRLTRQHKRVRMARRLPPRECLRLIPRDRTTMTSQRRITNDHFTPTRGRPWLRCPLASTCIPLGSP